MTCTVAQPISTNTIDGKVGLYRYMVVLTETFIKGAKQGTPVTLEVQHTGNDGVTAPLRFRVPVRYAQKEKRYEYDQPSNPPPSRIPNHKAILLEPAERLGKASVWGHGAGCRLHWLIVVAVPVGSRPPHVIRRASVQLHTTGLGPVEALKGMHGPLRGALMCTLPSDATA